MACVTPMTGMAVFTVFWDGVVIIHFLAKGTTITLAYYASVPLLQKLEETFKTKRCGMLT